jgi:hypothetical protein
MACDAETLKDVSWALVICNCVSSSTIGWKPISGKVVLVLDVWIRLCGAVDYIVGLWIIFVYGLLKHLCAVGHYSVSLVKKKVSYYSAELGIYP